LQRPRARVRNGCVGRSSPAAKVGVWREGSRVQDAGESASSAVVTSRAAAGREPGAPLGPVAMSRPIGAVRRSRRLPHDRATYDPRDPLRGWSIGICSAAEPSLRRRPAAGSRPTRRPGPRAAPRSHAPATGRMRVSDGSTASRRAPCGRDARSQHTSSRERVSGYAR
jgi:hypothetical protein